MAVLGWSTAAAVHSLIGGYAGGLGWRLAPQDRVGWGLLAGLALAAFLAGSLFSMVLASRKSDRPRQDEAQKLSAFLNHASHLDPHRKPGPQLALLVQAIFNVEAVAILDADMQEVYRAGEWFEGIENLVQNTYLFETVHDDPRTGLVRRVLRMGNLPVGALVLRGEPGARAGDAIASLAAITFDRYHAFANESRTEHARQAEQLRTTVLDSLAHAYKTPLTAIRAASTGLNEMGSLNPAQSGLVALIDEQSSLLNQLTTRLLKTARLEAPDLVLHAKPVAVLPLMEDLVAGLREQLRGLTVRVEASRDDLTLTCDMDLLVSVLTQYLENAGKYATAGTTVTVQAAERGGEVVFSVHNLGPEIPAADHERVFDRYFRSSAPTNKTPGTGLGLSVAKRAVQMQGGYVWVTSDAEKGTTFFASLPMQVSPPANEEAG